MDERGVWQVENLSMGWCLECHRAPEEHLRPLEEVTNMVWHLGDQVAGERGLPVVGEETLEDAQLRVGRELKNKYRDSQCCVHAGVLDMPPVEKSGMWDVGSGMSESEPPRETRPTRRMN